MHPSRVGEIHKASALGPKDRQLIATSVRAWIKDLEALSAEGAEHYVRRAPVTALRASGLWTLISTPSRTWLLTAGPLDLGRAIWERFVNRTLESGQGTRLLVG
jgi:hypothetical protein